MFSESSQQQALEVTEIHTKLAKLFIIQGVVIDKRFRRSPDVVLCNLWASASFVTLFQFTKDT